MSGTQDSEHSTSKEAEHTDSHEAPAHPHENHPSHGVPPSFANPLGEAPMEELEPMPTEGAQVDVLEPQTASAAKPVQTLAVQVQAHDKPEGEGIDAESASPVLLSEALGESVTPATQVTVLSADKWNEDYKVRVETLQQEIEELNIRLDQITAHKA